MANFENVIKLLKGYKDLPHGINKHELNAAIHVLSKGVGVLVHNGPKGSGKVKPLMFDKI